MVTAASAAVWIGIPVGSPYYNFNYVISAFVANEVGDVDNYGIDGGMRPGGRRSPDLGDDRNAYRVELDGDVNFYWRASDSYGRYNLHQKEILISLSVD